MPIDLVPNLRLQHLQFSRQGYRNLALFPVYRTNFNGNLETVLGAFAAPITRHGFHCRWTMLKDLVARDSFLDETF
jgi:hypothetical protein